MQGRGRGCKGIRRKPSGKVGHWDSHGFSDPPTEFKRNLLNYSANGHDFVLSFYLLLGGFKEVREGRRNPFVAWLRTRVR